MEVDIGGEASTNSGLFSHYKVAVLCMMMTNTIKSILVLKNLCNITF